MNRQKMHSAHIKAWLFQRLAVPAIRFTNYSSKACFSLYLRYAPRDSQNLIAPGYAQLNYNLHKSNSAYGKSGSRWAIKVVELAAEVGTFDVLGYGCGKQTLKRALSSTGIHVTGYDPCIPGLRMKPAPHDIVICADVLEHVEPDCIDALLDESIRCSQIAAIVSVATKLAIKFLDDGRNAHLTVQPLSWWQSKFESRFTIVDIIELPGDEFALLLQISGEVPLKTTLRGA